MTLTGALSYTGATTISAGTLTAAHSRALGTTASGTTVADGATLGLQGGISLVAEPLTLSGSGVNGAGALRSFSGNNTVRGTITLAADSRINNDTGNLTLDVASGVAVSGSGRQLTLGGAGTITVSDVLDLGNGALVKDGSGTVVLNANNSFSGTTTIGAGTLRLGSGGGVGSVAGDIVNDGILILARTDTALNLSGSISGSGSIESTGTSGKVTLSGNNSYTGTTSVLGNGGTLLASGPTALGSSQGGTTLATGARLELLNIGSSAEAITTTGPATLLNVGGDNTLTSGITAGGSTSITVSSGSLTLAPTSGAALSGSDTALNVAVNGGDLVVNGALQLGNGALNISSTSSGSTILNAANSYSGGTSVATATLVAASNGALGSGSAAVSNGATLGLRGDISLANAITLGAASPASGGTLRNLSGDNTLTDTVTLTGAAATITVDAGSLTLAPSNGTAISGSQDLFLTGAGTLSIQGVIATGAGALTKSGTGTATLAGDNSYTGTTTVSGGTLVAAHDNALGSSAAGTTVDNGASLALQGGVILAEPLTLNGNGQNGTGALRSLSGDNTLTGPITLGSDSRIQTDVGLLSLTPTSGDAISANNHSLSIGGAGNTLVGSPIALGTGSLTKEGSGRLSLLADNSYTGTTTISGGVLQLGNGGSTGSVAGDIVNNASLVVNHGSATTFTNAISGTGTLEQAGAGALTLTGALSYTGATTISGAGGLSVGYTVDVSLLSPAQVAALNSAEWATLSPAQIAQLSGAQVAAVSALQLGWLSSAQLAALSANQMAALTPAQLAVLSNSQLAQLSSDQRAALAGPA
ncbi:MAG: hypothetical protein C4K60_07025 [Ideonella sp. MAG2]|nr:MAG: hypothetical protein C4K60_07025 [Ideonella sp. MAG2]